MFQPQETKTRKKGRNTMVKFCKRVGVTVALSATTAMLVMAAGATAASAHEFFATAAHLKLASEATTNQVFVTNDGTVTCTKATGTGETTSTKASTQEMKVAYENCTFFDPFTGKTEGATISPATYNFNANGSVDILGSITVKAAFCTITVPAQEGVNKEGLKTVSFTTLGTESAKDRTIQETSNVGGIKYSAPFGCPSVGTFENGTYEGNNHTTPATGEIWWQ